MKLMFHSHAHIYGIDLASPLELVAHKRDPEAIAKHIGADSVIFQSLDDLKSACAEIAHEQGLTEPRKFEVGVFCGSYITPVVPGYFEHLEQIRGEGRKLKVVETAREAVAHGYAGQDELEIAAYGAEVDEFGKIVPVTSNGQSQAPLVNGIRSRHGSVAGIHEENPKVRDRMDISLHNFGDLQSMRLITPWHAI